MAISTRPRFLPDRMLPAYAYLPGSTQPHPVRDPKGHSYEQGELQPAQGVDTVALLWGIDLFNLGYYWEAHEAWEPLWIATKGAVWDRTLYKGLIMLAATGVKIRERKWVPAMRHADRAGKALRLLSSGRGGRLIDQIGIAPPHLATLVEAAAAEASFHKPISDRSRPECVFAFFLGQKSGG
ncbi:DUF309 domain-containing protein [Devosia beringensis]|uniref:DUF309 domain-containing protein n=1 Tax=Devosia beringensis TaxID=2657486 RepID=UPI001E3FBB1F|nr:DUF309 domain-containing protein [Devosia beringensis]